MVSITYTNTNTPTVLAPCLKREFQLIVANITRTNNPSPAVSNDICVGIRNVCVPAIRKIGRAKHARGIVVRCPAYKNAGNHGILRGCAFFSDFCENAGIFSAAMFRGNSDRSSPKKHLLDRYPPPLHQTRFQGYSVGQGGYLYCVSLGIITAMYSFGSTAPTTGKGKGNPTPEQLFEERFCGKIGRWME